VFSIQWKVESGSGGGKKKGERGLKNAKRGGRKVESGKWMMELEVGICCEEEAQGD
jgi:hypothetical protein